MTQFIRLTLRDGRPILVNVAQITDIMPNGDGDLDGTYITTSEGQGNSFCINESFDLIEANLRLMAYITDMETTA